MQTIKHTKVLVVVNRVLEEEFAQFEECGGSEQRVGASLVLRAVASNGKIFGKIIQATAQIATAFHKIFDVVNRGKVEFHHVEKVGLLRRQSVACEKFEEIAKVVARVKRDPMRLGRVREACDEQRPCLETNHLMSSFRTNPDVMRSSPKS